MSVQEYIDEYIEKFGGFPYFLVMGLPDSVIIRKIKAALDSGEEIKPVEGRIY